MSGFAVGAKRFVNWSFNHYLAIAPPEYAGTKWAAGSADDQNGAGHQQDDAEDAPGRERDLVEAKEA